MNKFDKYLKTASTKEKVMIVLSFFLGIGLVLNLVLPDILAQKDELTYSVEDLEMKLSRNNISRVKRELAKIKKEVLKKKEEIDKKQEDLDFVVSNVYKIKYALFNDLKLTKMLDEILAYSVKRDIKIISLKNSDIKEDSVSLLKKKKKITISGVGNYKDIVLFMQYIENFKALVSFEKIEMKLSEKEQVQFDLQMDVYGVGL
ncbi:hypothetical protein ACKGJI_05660 [Sulfurospirillum sp. 1307]|jgi:Tfp pilus assembly protein PilO